MAGFSLKPIKPKGKLFDIPPIEAAVREAMREVAEEGKDLYESSVSTWTKKPAFTITETKDGAVIGTDDEIFGFVDEGTKPHLIMPRKGTRLKFSGGYTAKSSPGQLKSGGGGVSGGVVFAKVVHHPGTESRNFTRLVQEKTQGSLPVVIAQKLGGVLGGD